MEFNKQTVKALLGVVCGGIAFAAALLHLDVVAGAAGWLLGILSPLLLGCAIAFILNVPMRTLERCLFPHAKKANKLRRPLALLLTVAAVSAVLALAGMVIVPGVRDAVASIAAQVPEAFERLQESAARFQEYLPLLANQIESLSIDWAGLSQKAVGLVQNWGKGLLISGGGLVSGIVSGVTTFFIGLIFSLYILLQKEKLARQGRQLCYAFLPEAAADQLLNILRLSERTFSSFLSGQCLEAVILGTMFFVSMTLLHFPYALLVGVLIALTALIPIVGAFIGCAVGALLMLVNEVQQEGSIDKDEGDLLKNAIGFSEQEAQDILIHRVDLAALPVDATKEEVADLFTQTKYSRLLIYREDIDHIIGTIHQKDFYVGCGVTDKPLDEILSPVMFVLENEPISLLLKKLQLAKTQVAVVVDEYGGTCGIVTMEDILEELVGEIWDEHDEEEVFIRKVDKDTYLVDAAMDFDDFAEFFHLNEETEMTSVSGWVMEQCDRVPEVGDRFSCQDLDVLVTRVDNHRTCEIKVVRREASGGEITDET